MATKMAKKHRVKFQMNAGASVVKLNCMGHLSVLSFIAIRISPLDSRLKRVTRETMHPITGALAVRNSYRFKRMFAVIVQESKSSICTTPTPGLAIPFSVSTVWPRLASTRVAQNSVLLLNGKKQERIICNQSYHSNDQSLVE